LTHNNETITIGISLKDSKPPNLYRKPDWKVEE
jgi:hypothetical protein